MTEVIFNYEGIETIIQCNKNDKMKEIINKYLIKIDKKEEDLYFLYSSNEIKKELTFNEHSNNIDKIRNKMNIIVYNNIEIPDKKIEEISKDIICPYCKENTLLDIKEFKINLSHCKNNHNKTLFLNEYKESQKICLNNIICDICQIHNKTKSYNNEFYICNICNKKICPLCKSIHDKNHVIINYDDRNYVCKKHNESFNKYCESCEENICIICENSHTNHHIIDFTKLLFDKNDLLKINEELKYSVDKFKYKIYIIKEILSQMVNVLDTYYKINNDIINNYNINKRNYYKLLNINKLKNNNEILIKDLKEIINNDNIPDINDIFNFSFNNFYNKNGEKYIGDIKNGLKEGKGILYFDKENNYLKKYQGEFKNDNFEGKGIFYWKNGDIYEGDFINGKLDGKGILYWKDGNKYEGDFKNDKKEGKGILYFINGNRYEGEFKNDIIEGKGIYYYNNDDRYEGDFINFKKDGNGIMYYKNGKVKNGIWKNDEFIGN